MTRAHELKTWPEPFQAVLDGRKRYEIRKDDRGYAVGDTLVLKEWDPSPHPNPMGLHRLQYEKAGYSGRVVVARIAYITPGGSWGLPADLCVMSIEVT